MGKTVGILAGLGPLAGAHFYRRLVELTPAQVDSEHLSVVLLTDNRIPSRLDHLAGRGVSPVPGLVSAAQRIEQAGADLLVIPSTTTHAYFGEIRASIGIPVLNLLSLAADTLDQKNCRRVGIVATTPTRDHHLYEGVLNGRGIQAVYPDQDMQDEIMSIIHGVKSTHRREPWETRLTTVLQGEWTRGVDSVLLACTETPVVFSYGTSVTTTLHYPLYDATDILAQATISQCAEGNHRVASRPIRMKEDELR